MNTANDIVQLEDPLNTINTVNTTVTTNTRKVKKTTPIKTIIKTHKTKKVDNKPKSGYQSDNEMVNEKHITKHKKKKLRKKRTPKPNISNHSKLVLSKLGKSSKLSKKVNFNRFLRNASKTKKSTKRRLHNIEKSLNIPSGYESDKEEESIMESMPDLPSVLLNNNPVSLKTNTPTSKSMVKSFVYQSKLQNGELTEKGEYVLNNSTKPYYIEGLIKDGKITEKMVRK